MQPQTSRVCEGVSHTQVVVEEVEEHQHAAAHDHKNADHDGGDVNRLFVLLLRGLVPLQLEVAPGGGKKKKKTNAVRHVNPRPPSDVHEPCSGLPFTKRLAVGCHGDHTAAHRRYLQFSSKHTIHAPHM